RPLGAGGARGPAAGRRPRRGRAPAAPPPVRAAAGERGVPGVLRLHPHRAAGRAGAARAEHDRRARHPPDRPRRRAARRLRHPRLRLPRYGGRPRRRHRPVPGAAPRRLPARGRQRPARRRRPARRGPPGRAARAARLRGTGPHRPGGAGRRPHRARARLPRLAGRRPHRPRRPRRPRRRAAGLPAHRGRRPRAGGDGRERRRRAHRRGGRPARRRRRRARARGRGQAARRRRRPDLGGAVSTLVTGIAELVTNDPALGPGPLGIVADAALVVDGGRVAWVGPAAAAPAADTRVDVDGRAVLPGFVDSHSHLVFAGERSAEFEARMSGVPYAAGGIASTGAATRAADDEALRARLRSLVPERRAQGTTTVEGKSGWGRTAADAERARRLAREVTAETTFPGARVVPAEYAGRVDEYV